MLTDKPVLYVCNVDESAAKEGNKYVEQIKTVVKNEKTEILLKFAQNHDFWLVASRQLVLYVQQRMVGEYVVVLPTGV